MKRKKSTKKVYYEIAWETRIIFISVFHLVLILIIDLDHICIDKRSLKNIIQLLGIQELCLFP